MVMLGRIFYSGVRGMPRDPVKAFQFFGAAAAKGDHSAMTYLAHLQARGANGVTQNFKAAYGNYTAAADAGFASAYNGLGFIFLNGFGVVPPDSETAVKVCTHQTWFGRGKKLTTHFIFAFKTRLPTAFYQGRGARCYRGCLQSRRLVVDWPAWRQKGFCQGGQVFSNDCAKGQHLRDAQIGPHGPKWPWYAARLPHQCLVL